VTVSGSTAVTTGGLPAIRRLDASTLPGASVTALNEKTTSADVNGAPSENFTPGRSLRV
jgi:hypothetical protein